MRGEHDHYQLISPNILRECIDCPFVKKKKDFTRDFTKQIVETYDLEESNGKPIIEIGCVPSLSGNNRIVFINVTPTLFVKEDFKRIHVKENVNCPAKNQYNNV